MFSLFNFSSIFQGGQLTPFAPMCGRPWFIAETKQLWIYRFTVYAGNCGVHWSVEIWQTDREGDAYGCCGG